MRVRAKNGEVCILQSSGERVVSEDSVTTCSASWFVYPYEAATANSPIISKSSHPIWSGLFCKSVSIKRHGTGAIITAEYEGSESWSSTDDSNENTVEVACTMREEPIESHPKFEYWAGTPEKLFATLANTDTRKPEWGLANVSNAVALPQN